MPRVLTSKMDRIDGNSRLPKYRQVINTILAEIKEELYKPGERLPSINETSEEYYLSRDTVEKAYKELTRRGVITSVPGKGYYVNDLTDVARIRVFVLVDKLTDAKQKVYNAFVRTMGQHAMAHLFIYEHRFRLFEHLLLDHLGKYDYYVILSNFEGEESRSAARLLKKVPQNKMLLLDRQPEGMIGNHGLVFQDFADDLHGVLKAERELFNKYKRFRMIFPNNPSLPAPFKKGAADFASEMGLPFDIIPKIDVEELKPGEAYFFMDEESLIKAIKKCQQEGWVPGQDIGLLSYDDTPSKEILAGGITTVSADHNRMGQTAADMILNKRRERVRNPFYLVHRNSL